jgi:hypothetical protein
MTIRGLPRRPETNSHGPSATHVALSYQRAPPGTWRGYEAGPKGLEILVIGAPNLGEEPREDVDGQRDWWAD